MFNLPACEPVLLTRKTDGIGLNEDDYDSNQSDISQMLSFFHADNSFNAPQKVCDATTSTVFSFPPCVMGNLMKLCEHTLHFGVPFLCFTFNKNKNNRDCN